MFSTELSLLQKTKLQINVNFEDMEWSHLKPENLLPFKLIENKRKCEAFPDGLFPGSSNVDENNTRQFKKVYKFVNLIEFSKIVSDEVDIIGDQMFLTSKFYERRKMGLESQDIKKKYGTIVGYNINGYIYNKDDKNIFENIYYEKVYKPQVLNDDKFNTLQRTLTDGCILCLRGNDKEFLRNISIVLLNSVKKKNDKK